MSACASICSTDSPGYLRAAADDQRRRDRVLAAERHEELVAADDLVGDALDLVEERLHLAEGQLHLRAA
mgnify:CR=1 FL=1